MDQSRTIVTHKIVKAKIKNRKWRISHSRAITNYRKYEEMVTGSEDDLRKNENSTRDAIEAISTLHWPYREQSIRRGIWSERLSSNSREQSPLGAESSDDRHDG